MQSTRIHEMFRAIDSREWHRLRNFLHPDIVYVRPGYLPFEGIERVLTFYEHERVIASGTHTLTTVVTSDVHAACCGRFVGMHRDGGAIDEEFADVYELAGPLIVRRQSYFFRPAV